MAVEVAECVILGCSDPRKVLHEYRSKLDVRHSYEMASEEKKETG